MTTAVVILNWNGRKMMERYLPNVKQHTAAEASIIVADNASTDDSVEWLKANHPDVGLITLDRNYGFAEGYNQALAHVDADYYVLLNSDVEVTAGWLGPIVSFMEQNGDVAACQPKLLSVSEPEKFEYAGACGGFIDRYGYPFCRGRLFDTVESDHSQYDAPAQVSWATGACMVVRARHYWDAGGLDGRFFAHNEEIDLCWRLKRLGLKIYCLPQSKVYHLGGGTLPKGNPMKTYLNFRNNLTMLYKNLPSQRLRRMMLVRCFLDYLAAVQTLVVNRNVGDFKAICRARRDFNRWKHDFDGDRPAPNSEDGADALTAYSILWQYHVRRRRRYSELP